MWQKQYIFFKKYGIMDDFILPSLCPSPSCPRLFLPQPNTAPDTESAKLCSPPAAIRTSGTVDRDWRCWGETGSTLLCPTPSWPLEFWPHVYTWPSVEESPWVCELHTAVYRTVVCSLQHFSDILDWSNPLLYNIISSKQNSEIYCVWCPHFTEVE